MVALWQKASLSSRSNKQNDPNADRMTWANLRHQLLQVLATIVLFAGMPALNELLFRQLEFAPGINWVYLPAGMRLLCTLLFAEAGAVELLIVSWAVSFLVFFPRHFDRAFMGGILATAAPYLVYRAARRRSSGRPCHG